MGKCIAYIYEKLYKKTAPTYVYEYSVWDVIFKPIRKWLTNTVAAGCPFNCVRIFIYRICGFSIGKHTHIGMHCYLDDHCYSLIQIGNHVTISYGVYFSCHGAKQEHAPIIVKDGVYIGMRANLISNNRDKTQNGIIIGENAVVGSSALVNCNVDDNATAIGIPCKIIMKEGKQ